MDYQIDLNFSNNTKSTIEDAIREFDQAPHPIILNDPSKVTEILIGAEGALYKLISGLPSLMSDLDLEDLADALKAEGEYFAKGKDAFVYYDEYRAKRLGQGV